MHDRLRPFGFTLIEMLVAVAVTSVMMVAISQIFKITTDAVRQGIATSSMMLDVEAFSDQFQDDINYMIGPSTDSPGGVLVILNGQVKDSNIVDSDIKSGYQRTVRSDQVIFLRDARHLRSQTPRNPDTFENEVRAATARVWYGHVERASPQGLSYFDLNASGEAGKDEPQVGGLGEPDIIPFTNEAVTPGINQLAANWVVGRQGLLFAGDDAAGGIHVDNSSFDPKRWSFDVAGYESMTSERKKLMPRAKLHWGVSDVTDEASDELQCRLSEDEIASDPNAYAQEMYRYVFGRERLRVNPRPSNQEVESWHVAQMHPYMLANVSDFIVEFAGDFAEPRDGAIDTDMNGRIIWYSHFPDEKLSVVRPATGNQIGMFNDENRPQASAIYDTTNQPKLADAAFVFRHSDNDPTTCMWPQLLRLRYRVHDRGGLFRDKDDLPGRWYELVVPIKRFHTD